MMLGPRRFESREVTIGQASATYVQIVAGLLREMKWSRKAVMP